jgi:hypothetical protein
VLAGLVAQFVLRSLVLAAAAGVLAAAITASA